METVFTPHYALIFAAVSVIFFGGKCVAMLRQQRQDSIEQKQENKEIKEMLHEIKLKSTETNINMMNSQEQGRLHNVYTERELETLKNRIDKLENEKRSA